MAAWVLKLRLIFLPFLIMGIVFIGLYTLMNWLLFIKFELLPIKEIIRNIGLPGLLLVIPLFVWLKPRFHLLASKNENSGRPFYYLMVAFVAIVLPTIIAQEYLTTSTGKLTELSGMNSISDHAKTKYYTVEKYHVSKRDFGAHVTSEVTGRRHDKLWISLYIALPVYESTAEAISKYPHAWLGIKYTDVINNHLSDVEKERKFDAFMERSQKDFDAKNVQEFVYLDRLGSSDDLDGYQKALEESSKFSGGNEVVLLPIHTPFEYRNAPFELILLSFTLGAFSLLLLISFPKIDQKALADFLNGKPPEHENTVIEFISEFMIPTKDFFVTPILIVLNIFIFLLLFLQGYGFMSVQGEDLMHWGANYGPSVAKGEYWRLLTNIFLHGGFVHLAGNIYGLVMIGPLLEPVLGKAKFTFAYLATGVIASLSSIYWYDAIVSVGASGAIFGLCGVLLALLATKTLVFEQELNSYLMGMLGVFVGGNLLMGVMGNVDNAAHIGGLASGFILGLLQSLLTRFKSHDLREEWVDMRRE